jgi:FKBP-type peptidyl-prolyl cis-trans isomerase
MTRFPKTRSLPLAALLVLALLAAGCGSSTSESAADKSAAKAESEAKNQKPVPEAKAPASPKVDPTPGEADINTKPTVPKGSGAAPTALKAETLIAGNGAEIKSGQQATVNYVGVLYKTGKEFDTSWGGQPAQFPLTNVIEGWQSGLPGMKVGGRRLLVIPAEQAYGDSPPSGSGIEAGEALVFVVDLVSVP